MKAKTLILTAHGVADKTDKMKLPIDLITTCKFGETHSGKHLTFSDLNIFTNKNFLYKYLLTNDDDYTNQGEFIRKGTEVPMIIVTPYSSGQAVKNWSWQKPYIEQHFMKMCIYELIGRPSYTYKLDQIKHDLSNWGKIKDHAREKDDIKLLTELSIIEQYSQDTHSQILKVDNAHVCLLTHVHSSGTLILDYEAGPSKTIGANPINDQWELPKAIASISDFCTSHSIDLSGLDSFVLKACLNYGE